MMIRTIVRLAAQKPIRKHLESHDDPSPGVSPRKRHCNRDPALQRRHHPHGAWPERIGAEKRLNAADAAWRVLARESANLMDTLRRIAPEAEARAS